MRFFIGLTLSALGLLFSYSVVAQNPATCDQTYAGFYEQKGGAWQWWIDLKADCTGSRCTQTLNDWDNPASGYGWNCDRPKEEAAKLGLIKIKHWQHAVIDGREYIVVTRDDGSAKKLDIRRNGKWLLVGQAAQTKKY